MARPFEGIRVLELGNLIAEPFCSMPPMVNGESTSFAALNRNKRSLVLDLKQPEAREILLQLAAKSDVLLENSRPGALEKLGFGAEQVRAVNPASESGD